MYQPGSILYNKLALWSKRKRICTKHIYNLQRFRIIFFFIFHNKTYALIYLRVLYRILKNVLKSLRLSIMPSWARHFVSCMGFRFLFMDILWVKAFLSLVFDKPQNFFSRVSRGFKTFSYVTFMTLYKLQ